MATSPVSSATDILGSGLIVQLKIKLWTGTAELETNDIGMKPEELAEHFQLGRKLLVTRDALDPVRQVARRAKYALEQLSHPLPDGGRFLLAQTTPEILAALQAHRREFFETVERFIAIYPAAHRAFPEAQCLRRQHARADHRALRADLPAGARHRHGVHEPGPARDLPAGPRVRPRRGHSRGRGQRAHRPPASSVRPRRRRR